jgi:hypothetical protein
MQTNSVRARLTPEGAVALTRAAAKLAESNSKSKSNNRLNNFIDISSDLIESIEYSGLYIEGEEELLDTLEACRDLVKHVLKGHEISPNMKLAEAARRAIYVWNSDFINNRLSNAQLLMEYINGYDCYNKWSPNMHPFDKSMSIALAKTKKSHDAKIMRKLKSDKIPF